jgi:hypothetical protein
MPVLRLLSTRQHAICDWILIAFGLGAPLVFSMTGLAAYYTWAIAGFGVVLNAFTDYPLSLMKIIPPKIHSLVEWTAPGVFIVAPLVLFPGVAGYWVLPAIGVVNFATNATTDWPRKNAAI